MAILLAVLVILPASLLLIALILWGIKWRRQLVSNRKSQSEVPDEQSIFNSRHFTYSELVTITNNFERVIGVGGFGTVFHGMLESGYQVAVKLRSQQTQQATREFMAEVELLTRVHHRNLVSLIGYCEENNCQALVYEYMAQGNLKEHLTGRATGIVLSWRERLLIVLDAAQGVEYLHRCKPAIVHRDVKTSNILLHHNFEAKVADFGLSKAFQVESQTHTSTVVAGTPGYLDPEYYSTGWLKEKSDVYSFGVVLLEVITGQPAVVLTQEKAHIVEWVRPLVAGGNIADIVDTKLSGECDASSVRKVVELAMKCAAPLSAKRPTMSDVVMQLKECLALEIAHERSQSFSEESTGNNRTDTVEIPLVRMITRSRYFDALDSSQSVSVEMTSSEIIPVASGPMAR